MGKRIIAGAIFFVLFFMLERCGIADAVRLRIIFRYIVVPAYQWALILAFVLSWKLLTGESWPCLLRSGAILGLAMCLYPPLLDTQRLVWSGASLSRMYVIYINAFVFMASLAVYIGGIGSLLSANGAFFFPLLPSALYGTYFFSRAGHMKEALGVIIAAAALSLIFRDAKARKDMLAALRRTFSNIMERKALIMTAVFIFALALRLAFLLNLLSIEGSRYPYASDDGDTYDLWGVQGSDDPMIYLRKSPHYFMIFYSVLLSVIYRVFGHNYLITGIVQSLIGASLASMIFVLAERTTKNAVAALIAAVGVSVNSALIHLTTTLNTEVLYLPLLVLFILALLFYRESRQGSRAIALICCAGFILGLAAIVRQIALGIFIPAVFWVLVWGRNYARGAIAKRVRDTCLLLVFAMLPIMPITCCNYMNTGRFYLIYNTAERQMWDRLADDAKEEPFMPTNRRFIELGIKDLVFDPAGGIQAALKRPGEVLAAAASIVPRRMAGFFLSFNFGNFDPIYLLNGIRCANRYASHLEFYTALLLAASFIIFFSSKIENAHKALVAMVVAFYGFFYGIFLLCYGPRYRSPIDPFVAIIVSLGLCTAVKWMIKINCLEGRCGK